MWPSNVLQWINLANSNKNHLLHRHWHVCLGDKSTSKFLYSIVCAHCFLYYSKSASTVPPCLRVLYENVWCMLSWIPFSCFSPTFYPKYYLGEPEFEDFDAEFFIVCVEDKTSDMDVDSDCVTALQDCVTSLYWFRFRLIAFMWNKMIW